MIKKYFKLFEVVSDGASRIFNLPTGDILKNSKVTAVEAYTSGSFATKGTNQQTTANLADCYLKLVNQNGETMIDSVPLKRIDPINNNGQPWAVQIDNLNPSDCQIVVGAAAVPASGQVFQIGFYYEKNYC